MLITGAENAAGVGTPQRSLPLVPWSTGFTELAHVPLGAQASLHPGGRRGKPPLGRRQADLSQEHLAWERGESEREEESHTRTRLSPKPFYSHTGRARGYWPM